MSTKQKKKEYGKRKKKKNLHHREISKEKEGDTSNIEHKQWYVDIVTCTFIMIGEYY